MANNELSGPVVLNALLSHIKNFKKQNLHTGLYYYQKQCSISYLSKYHKVLKNYLLVMF